MIERLTRILIGSGTGILLMWAAAGVVDVFRFHRLEGFLAPSHNFLYSGIVLILAGVGLRLFRNGMKQTETRPRRFLALHVHFPRNITSAALPDVLKDTLRAAADYALVVCWGIALGLALLNVLRIDPASFIGGPYSPIRVRASIFVLYGYVAVILSIPGLAVGALLSLAVQRGQRLGMPGYLLRVLGTVGSFVVTLVLLAMASSALVGDVTSMGLVFFLGSILSVVFGLFFLVRDERRAPTRPRVRHWLALGLPAIYLLQGIVMIAWVRSVGVFIHDPKYDVVFVKWVPGPEDLAVKGTWDSQPYYMHLTDGEMNQLRTLGLRGQLQPWAGGAGDFGSPKVKRIVVLMYHPISADVDLPKPKDHDVMYVQTQEGWKKVPESAATLPRGVRLSYGAPTPQESNASTKYAVDNGYGAISSVPTLFSLVLGKTMDFRMTAFTWTAEEEEIDPAVGRLSPPAKAEEPH
ncbi:MAG TPA: hypothetical protein VEH47_03130 [Candidatus Acidoferrales bacterium]|nr:hypothetical protein [Candidatus Acidoferrales bacterium]